MLYYVYTGVSVMSIMLVYLLATDSFIFFPDCELALLGALFSSLLLSISKPGQLILGRGYRAIEWVLTRCQRLGFVGWCIASVWSFLWGVLCQDWYVAVFQFILVLVNALLLLRFREYFYNKFFNYLLSILFSFISAVCMCAVCLVLLFLSLRFFAGFDGSDDFAYIALVIIVNIYIPYLFWICVYLLFTDSIRYLYTTYSINRLFPEDRFCYGAYHPR